MAKEAETSSDHIDDYRRFEEMFVRELHKMNPGRLDPNSADDTKRAKASALKHWGTLSDGERRAMLKKDLREEKGPSSDSTVSSGQERRVKRPRLNSTEVATVGKKRDIDPEWKPSTASARKSVRKSHRMPSLAVQRSGNTPFVASNSSLSSNSFPGRAKSEVQAPDIISKNQSPIILEPLGLNKVVHRLMADATIDGVVLKKQQNDLRLRSMTNGPQPEAGQQSIIQDLPEENEETQDEQPENEETMDASVSSNSVEADSEPAKKRSGYITWEEYFMAVAFLSAQRSKDPSSQVGACIVNSENKIVGIGYNGMPNGCDDDALPWNRKGPFLETKYPYVVHAGNSIRIQSLAFFLKVTFPETNAIMNKNASSTKGCTMYVALFPCNECAKLCIQAGIREIVFAADKYHNEEKFIASRKLLDMAGIPYRKFIRRSQKIVIDFGALDEQLPPAV